MWASAGGAATTTEQDAGTEDEAEVVASTSVVDFVDVHAAVEQRDDEREPADGAVPPAQEEPGRRGVGHGVGRVDHLVGLRHAAGHEDQGEQGEVDGAHWNLPGLVTRMPRLADLYLYHKIALLST